MGLALAIVFLWVSGLLLWIAFHNMDKLKSETNGLPGILGALVNYVQTGESPVQEDLKGADNPAPSTINA